MKTKIRLQVPLPIDIEIIKKGIRYIIVKMTLDEIKNVDIKILSVENFNSHQEYGKCKYTKKVLNLERKIPRIIKYLISMKAFTIEEESYDHFPFTTTFFRSAYFTENNFLIKSVSNFCEYAPLDDHIDIYSRHHLDDNDSYIELEQNLHHKTVLSRDIEISINLIGESKITKEIKKSMTALFLKKCRLLVKYKDQYRNLTEKELDSLESELLKKLKYFH